MGILKVLPATLLLALVAIPSTQIWAGVGTSSPKKPLAGDLVAPHEMAFAPSAGGETSDFSDSVMKVISDSTENFHNAYFEQSLTATIENNPQQVANAVVTTAAKTQTAVGIFAPSVNETTVASLETSMALDRVENLSSPNVSGVTPENNWLLEGIDDSTLSVVNQARGGAIVSGINPNDSVLETTKSAALNSEITDLYHDEVDSILVAAFAASTGLEPAAAAVIVSSTEFSIATNSYLPSAGKRRIVGGEHLDASARVEEKTEAPVSSASSSASEKNEPQINPSEVEDLKVSDFNEELLSGFVVNNGEMSRSEDADDLTTDVNKIDETTSEHRTVKTSNASDATLSNSDVKVDLAPLGNESNKGAWNSQNVLSIVSGMILDASGNVIGYPQRLNEAASTAPVSPEAEVSSLADGIVNFAAANPFAPDAVSVARVQEK